MKEAIVSAQYEPITLGVSDLDRIELPKFQRGFVWSKHKKNEFVETLHNGFPFGALLVYPESEETGSRLLLLDGQQRLSTIRQYKENPLLFWKPNNQEIYDEHLDRINALLANDAESHAVVTKQEFDELVSGRRDLADWSDEVAANNGQTRKQLRDTIKDLQREIRDYVNLDDLSILAIKFTGSKKHLAAVFANLNKGGMPLSKYEIYNAAWVNATIELLPLGASHQQDEILELVKDYYTEMANDAEFDLNDFSEDELTINRTITLSELGTALGAYVQKKLDSLVSDTPNSINEIGFGLLGIATDTDNRQLSNLNDKLDSVRDNLQAILEKTERICNNLQDIFSKLLKRINATKSNRYETGLSTTFKTLSYFAALWSLDPESDDYRTSLSNIRSYYVFDSWTKVWSSHGDQRLLEYYPKFNKRDYKSPIERDAFLEAMSQWLSDATPGINFSRETKALVTIHANLSYLSSVIPHGETFELEHIIAKKRINEVDLATNRKVYGSALGNCMYLPKQLNNKKKEKTLYEINDAGQYDELIAGSLYFPNEVFTEIFLALKEKDYTLVNNKIEERGKKVGEDLIERLLKE